MARKAPGCGQADTAHLWKLRPPAVVELVICNIDEDNSILAVAPACMCVWLYAYVYAYAG